MLMRIILFDLSYMNFALWTKISGNTVINTCSNKKAYHMCKKLEWRNILKIRINPLYYITSFRICYYKLTVDFYVLYK